MLVDVGVVVIGRNEGERLRRCLSSLSETGAPTVYVDSGSSDASLELAEQIGVDVFPLDPAKPFTAARARNEGLFRLLEQHPRIAFVQFVDGDCELRPDWLETAASFLEKSDTAAVVCGRLRERHPDATIYNRLCEIEWDQAPGPTHSCGGIAMYRTESFLAAGGFAEDMIAGEEPDLCFRIRSAGGEIVRLASEMASHDAAMVRPHQWWQRSKRSGFAAAHAWHRRGKEEKELLRQVISNFFWAQPLSWALWPLLWLKTSRHHGPLYATHIVLGKVPHAFGQFAFFQSLWRDKRPGLIEHK